MREKVLSFLQKEVELGNIPGAAIYISHRGECLLEESVGYRILGPGQEPASISTVYDLASITKVAATLPSILRLIDDGALRLEDPLFLFIPEFGRGGKETITIRHLLTHTSGLPAHRRFYEGGMKTEQIIAQICNEELASSPGEKVVYSDLGMIMLYAAVERITGQPFQDYVREEFFEPMEMTETGFNLPFEKSRFAATEYSERLGEIRQGVVHDGNAETMSGISGHAGLFSTVRDMAKFAEMVEGGGLFRGKRILSQAALEMSRQNETPGAFESRGLGWSLKSPGVLSCGDLFSSSSYGHTGYTGTSIWFDPDKELHVILLTHRVHAPHQEAILRLRPRLHNLICAQL